MMKNEQSASAVEDHKMLLKATKASKLCTLSKVKNEFSQSTLLFG